jgi:aerobic-type carbon monoxide dehydrogenase small subunit (CoxS/CutS family)
MADITVNGATKSVEASDDAALLWVLRDELGLTAAKYGCGLDQCGSCTVLVAGKRAAACQLTVSDVAGREVTTLESLVSTPAGERVVQALLDANAGQCGYCLPGIAVSLIALASEETRPASRADIARALDTHLCRCGSQPRILTAAMNALEVTR